MSFSIRNIIIFVGLAAVFTSIYISFFKNPDGDVNLVSSSGGVSQSAPSVVSGGVDNALAQNFLSLLLNIKNIRLNDEIFNDPAFNSLRDSSIVLVPDVNTGRINPFAQFGSDPVPANPTPIPTPTPSASSANPTTPVNSTTPPVGTGTAQ